MRRTLARFWPHSAPDSLRARLARARHEPLPDLAARTYEHDIPHIRRADELAERAFARMEQRQDPSDAIAQLAAEFPTSGRLAVARVAIENDRSAYTTIAAREEDLHPEDLALLRTCPPPSDGVDEWVLEWWRMMVRDCAVREPARDASECETSVAHALQTLLESRASALSMGFYCGPFYVSGPQWHEEGKDAPRVIMVEHHDTRFTDDSTMWRWADMRRAQYLQSEGFDVITGVSEEEWGALPDEDARLAFLKSKL